MSEYWLHSDCIESPVHFEEDEYAGVVMDEEPDADKEPVQE
jgi:hypothetical protein